MSQPLTSQMPAAPLRRHPALSLALGLTLVLLASCGRPVARFTPVVADSIAPATVRFANASERAEAYKWDFGDGDTSTLEAPDHRYGGSGNYLVTLRAVGKRGRVAVDTHRVQIVGPLNCMVEISTPYGKMLVALSDKTPQHRDNFIKLVEEGFYEDLIFHRVIDGFMLQGGDPNSRESAPGTPLGSGGPGYQLPAEFTPELAHVKGALAAARMGDQVNPEKKSSGSQFYIVSGRPVNEQDLISNEARKEIRYTPETRAAYLERGGVPFLDAEYTVFGQVVEGLEVIDRIASAKTRPGDRPVEDITMRMRVVD